MSLRVAQHLAKEERIRAKVQKHNEEQDEILAEELAQEELQSEQDLKSNPRAAQEKLLYQLMKDSELPKDEELEWCNKKLNHRISDAPITHVTIKGHTSSNQSVKINVTMYRGMRTQTEAPQFLKFYGYSEWLEIRDAIQKSKSKFKGEVERHLDQLFQRISQVVQVPPLPEKSNKRTSKSDAEEGPSFKNEHETKFGIDDILNTRIVLPDLSMLDTSLPEGTNLDSDEIITLPEAGMSFRDNYYELRFLRNKEIKKAPSKLLKVLYYCCWVYNDPLLLQKKIYEKELKRRKEKLSD